MNKHCDRTHGWNRRRLKFVCAQRNAHADMQMVSHLHQPTLQLTLSRSQVKRSSGVMSSSMLAISISLFITARICVARCAVINLCYRWCWVLGTLGRCPRYALPPSISNPSLRLKLAHFSCTLDPSSRLLLTTTRFICAPAAHRKFA